MITVSAVCKFNPKPPALVDNKKAKYSESGALYNLSNSERSSGLVEPSNLRYFMSIIRKKSSMMSMI
ncbi:hypothetical protein WICPIJ_004254 [Wickerhamomyces pijperi]|uniref:Uncharacterized protein n=1 Tax=Wickerhamomyces pijperi TaxID=599730 RepID=A0A9P8Q8B3_WICPI|nr:hypothetical protein WICPIJ_004254 [Wickerhamomyces pijperi]